MKYAWGSLLASGAIVRKILPMRMPEYVPTRAEPGVP